MNSDIMKEIIFLILALFAVISAWYVALSRNIVRCAFAMVVTFLSVAGIFALLSADFLAITQLLIYVGGILVLILFAVMLSSKIREIEISNLSIGFVSAGLVILPMIILLVYLVLQAPWKTGTTVYEPTTAALGRELLSRYVLPFEIVSVLFLVALIGAVVIARKERD